MANPYWIVHNLPDPVLVVIGATHGFAFVAGPLAMLAAVRLRRSASASNSRVRATLAALMCLSVLSVTVPAVTGTTLLLQEYVRIGSTGRGGVGQLSAAVIAAARPLLLGLGTLAACGAILFYRSLRPRAGDDETGPEPERGVRTWAVPVIVIALAAAWQATRLWTNLEPYRDIARRAQAPSYASALPAAVARTTSAGLP